MRRWRLMSSMHGETDTRAQLRHVVAPKANDADGRHAEVRLQAVYDLQ